MVDVFISYPRAERPKAERIKAKLDAFGLVTFFDIQGIDGGDEFPVVIDRAVKAAKAVLGCWSPLAFTRPWVMQECRVARMRGILVPVAIEAFNDLAPPTEFIGVNCLDLTDFDGTEPHEGWTRTLRALSRHVGRDLVSTSASSEVIMPPPVVDTEDEDDLPQRFFDRAVRGLAKSKPNHTYDDVLAEAERLQGLENNLGELVISLEVIGSDKNNRCRLRASDGEIFEVMTTSCSLSNRDVPYEEGQWVRVKLSRLSRLGSLYILRGVWPLGQR